MSIHLPSAVMVLEVYSLIKELPEPHLRDGDLGSLVASIEVANTSFAGKDMYEGIHRKVAAVASSINRNHPLIDGNKRLSYLLMVMLYQGNGYTYVGTGSQADLFVWIAATRPSNAEIANKLSQLWV